MRKKVADKIAENFEGRSVKEIPEMCIAFRDYRHKHKCVSCVFIHADDDNIYKALYNMFKE